MTDIELFNILRPIVMKITGVPQCILADQNQQAPNTPYATIRPRQSITERGQANIYNKDIPGAKVEGDARAQVICTASVQFWRGDALMYAERLKQGNKRFDVSIDLFKAKIGWQGTGPVNNLTVLQSANQEQRSQIDIRLMYEVSNTSEVNAILSTGLIIENEKAVVIEQIDVPN